MIFPGVIGVAGHQWLQAEGMLSAALAPAFMVILASFFIQGRIAPDQVAGLVLALLGEPGLSDREGLDR